MALRPELTDDAVFDKLCDLLEISPRQRTLANCLKIGQLFHRIRQSRTQEPGRTKKPYRTDWAAKLLKRLAGRGIRLSESLMYRFLKLETLQDTKFRNACRKAKRARWEDVMCLLGVKDATLRLEFLAMVDEREEVDELSVRTFKEVVRHRVAAKDAQASRATRVPRQAVMEAARKLQATSQRAVEQVTYKIKGKASLLGALNGLTDVDAAQVARVQADIRQFRAAAARLDQSLGHLKRSRR